MDTLNKIGRKITTTAKTVTRRSEDMVEMTKLNLAISNKEDKINAMFYELGSEVYRSYTNGESLGDLYETKCAEVKLLEGEIRALRERRLALKGNKLCKACDLVVGSHVNYCPNCGEKLVQEQVEE